MSKVQVSGCSHFWVSYLMKVLLTCTEIIENDGKNDIFTKKKVKVLKKSHKHKWRWHLSPKMFRFYWNDAQDYNKDRWNTEWEWHTKTLGLFRQWEMYNWKILKRSWRLNFENTQKTCHSTFQYQFYMLAIVFQLRHIFLIRCWCYLIFYLFFKVCICILYWLSSQSCQMRWFSCHLTNLPE